jgi:putative transcriptional regulator
MTGHADLTGKLLVATPEISEGVFRRSVVLLLHHGEDGAQGIILGQPLATLVSALLPTWSDPVLDDPHAYFGGPVQTDSALGVAALVEGRGDTGVARLYGDLGLVDLDADPEVVTNQVSAMRVFVGYAGWSAGQLEGEITSGSWFVVDRRPGDVLHEAGPALWSRVLARQPGPLGWLATYPDDPSLN